jgi:tRNA dimethylallyltransferase
VTGGREDRLVVVIGGLTASGKSALALALAEAAGGTVINADSMQLYRDLRVLSARPDDATMARVPHALFGILPGDDPCSAGRWRGMALEAIEGARAEGRLPIVVGGTGLYIKALTEGIDEIPPVPAPVRAAARAKLAAVGGPGLHAELARRDPEGARRIAPTDSQRLVRAIEVLEATGRPLHDWQGRQMPQHGPNLRFATVLLMPPRPALYAACDARFAAMVEAGAIEEVRALMALGLDPALPIMKAVGVRELARHIAGELTLDEAVAAGQQATRRYAKRQYTWFGHQCPDAAVCHAQYSESLAGEIFAKIRQLG